MIALVALLATASAVELSAGPLLEDGYRPGARAGLQWTLTDTIRDGKNGRSATHAVVAGPDFATYVVPGVRWASIPGGTIGYHRTARRGFRMGVDLSGGVAFQKYAVPTYTMEGGELTTVTGAGRIRLAPGTRLTIGVAPTDDRPWGAVFRPTAFFEFPRNGMLAPVLAAEVAGLWSF